MRITSGIESIACTSGGEAHTVEHLVVDIKLHELPMTGVVREVAVGELWCRRRVALFASDIRCVVAKWRQVRFLSIAIAARLYKRMEGACALGESYDVARQVITEEKVGTLEKLCNSLAFRFKLRLLVVASHQALLIALALGRLAFETTTSACDTLHLLRVGDGTFAVPVSTILFPRAGTSWEGLRKGWHLFSFLWHDLLCRAQVHF